MPRRKAHSVLSLDNALRALVQREVNGHLDSIRHTLSAVGGEMTAIRALAERLAPLASLMGGGGLPLRRGPGRPPKALAAFSWKRRRGRKAQNGVRAADRACAVIGCRRPSRTKGYCAAHYQKLRLLDRTKRRPSEWAEYASPSSVTDIVLPRGRAAAKARQKQAD